MDSRLIYRYSSIEQVGTIRLILLAPSEQLDAVIKCSLIHTTIEECDYDITEHYIALSYVWGDSTSRRTIMVDGKKLSVTTSLDEALRYVRDSHRVLRVWADGVCINQDDVDDRNRQVQQMRRIYSTALHTVIFLGPSSPKCDSIMKFLEMQQRRITQGYEKVVLDTGGRLNFLNDVEEHIVNKIWFTRLWVIQELALSTDPWVQCGTRRARWGLFSDQILSSYSSMERDSHLQSLISLNSLRVEFQDNQRGGIEPPDSTTQLFNILKKTRGSGASDPRDQIYAILGLVKSSEKELISVNYNLTISQVYETVARLYMAYWEDMSILSWIGEPILSKRSDDIPSWVPDWRIRQPLTPRTGEVEMFSTCVPRILAVVGVDCGSVKALIAQSSWPPRTAEMNDLEGPEFKKDMLEWLTTTEPQKQELRQYLYEYYYQHHLSRYLESRSHSIRPEPSFRLSPEYLAVLEPIVSEWFPVSASKHKFWGQKVSSRNSLIYREAAILISSILQYSLIPLFALPSMSGKQIAVLEGGKFAEVPEVTALGDMVVTLLEKDYLYILRSHESQVSVASQEAIKGDLKSRTRNSLNLSFERIYAVTNPDPSNSDLISCKYVTSCWGAEKGGNIDIFHNRAYIIRGGPKQAHEMKIFMIH